jgi:hypothetical protein
MHITPAPQSPRFYSRQDVFNAIMRNQNVNNKKTFKEQAIVITPEGMQKRVAMNEDLYHKLII